MKKKIISLALVVCLLAIAIVGGTMAYFTDTAAQTNTFTAGKVDIILYEHKVAKDTDKTSERFGDLVSTGDLTVKDQSYHLFPAMTVDKDPTIRVEKGSEDAYVAAKVTITGDVASLMPLEGLDGYIDINALASGGLLEETTTYDQTWNVPAFVNETCAVHQDPGADGKSWTLYIFMLNPQAAETTITLFETLTIPAEYDHDQMTKLNGMEIAVEAYATQTNGFVDCYDAMTNAFSTDFVF